MVTLVFASCSFLSFSPVLLSFLFFFLILLDYYYYYYYYYFPLFSLYLHSIGLWALLCLLLLSMFCSLCLGGLHFHVLVV